MVWNNPVIPNNIILSYAYVWTTGQTVRRDNLVTTTADGWVVENTTAATNAVPVQVSPSFTRVGTARKTNSTAASHIVKIRDNLLPVSGAAAVSGIWRLQWSINGAAFSDLFTVDTAGNIVATGGGTFNGVSVISKTASNGQPSTVDHLTLHNPAGWYSHIAFKFGSTIKSGISADSSWALTFRMTSSTGVVYEFGSSITWTSYVTQIFSGGIYSSGGWFYGGKVTAWSANQSAHSTMTNYGSFGWKSRYITANTTLDAFDFISVVNASDAETCTGSPTNPCGYYTTSGACAGVSILNCAWSGWSCSEFNWNQGECEWHSPCAYETTSCSVFWSQYDCELQTPCAWYDANPSCGSFNETDCYNMAMNGCSQQFGSCTTNYSNPCSWDGMTCNGGWPCDGQPDEASCLAVAVFSSCSGDTGCDSQWSPEACAAYFPFLTCNWNYSSYSCVNSYYTGNCTGAGYGTCWWTAICTNVPNESCTSYGCTLADSINIALPAIASVFDGNKVGRPYLIQKIDSSAGTVVLDPYGDETIEWASTATLTTQWQSLLIFPFIATGDCSTFSSVGACTPSGCGWTYYECSSFSNSEDCTPSGCSWDWMVCSGQYGWYCSGTYIISKHWLKLAIRS